MGKVTDDWFTANGFQFLQVNEAEKSWKAERGECQLRYLGLLRRDKDDALFNRNLK